MTEIEYFVEWNLRTKAVADDGREFLGLLNGIVEWLDEQQSWDPTKRNYLTRRECRDLWAWLGRTDKVPKRLTFYIWGPDVEKIETR